MFVQYKPDSERNLSFGIILRETISTMFFDLQSWRERFEQARADKDAPRLRELLDEVATAYQKMSYDKDNGVFARVVTEHSPRPESSRRGTISFPESWWFFYCIKNPPLWGVAGRRVKGEWARVVPDSISLS